MYITIKKTLPEDIDFIKKLEIKCSLSEWTIQDYLSETNLKNSIFLTAFYKSDKVGFLLARQIPGSELSYEKGTAEIYNFAVEAHSRQKGIGSKLLEEFIVTARNNDTGSIYLEVRKSNLRAQKFYKKNGFLIIGERKNFYTNPVEDALLMKLELS